MTEEKTRIEREQLDPRANPNDPRYNPHVSFSAYGIKDYNLGFNKEEISEVEKEYEYHRKR